MKKYLIAASVAAMIAATGAQAADVIVPQQPAPVYVAPAFSWTGFYVGGQIGGSWGDTDSKVRNDAGFSKNFSPDPDGFIGGLYAGYNFDVGNNIVLGVETDFVWGNLDEKSSTDYGVNRLTDKVKQEWGGATRVRAGYAMDRFLPYIAGGVAYGKVKTSYSVKNAAGVHVESASDDDTLTGWTIGAGVDYAVTNNVLLRLEYRYTDYGDESYKNSTTGMRYNVDHKTNDVRIGVAYKF